MSNIQEKTNRAASIILAIDTSSPEMSLAVSHEERIIASLYIQDNRPHSQTLFTHVSTLLKLTGTSIQDLGAIAVSTGPGSFTGVRVGLAAVKGLADTLGKPCYGINSIDLIALATGFHGPHLVMINAGRGEVYCGVRIVASGEVVESNIDDLVGAPSIVLESLNESLKDHLKSAILVIASNMKTDCPEIERFSATHRQSLLINPTFRTIDALVQRTAFYLKKNQKLSIPPHYIRQSDAEIKLMK